MSKEIKFQLRKSAQNQQIVYVNENDFIKKYRGLKRICPDAFRNLCFYFFKNGICNKQDGDYVYDAPTSPEFKVLFGQIKVIYSIKNGIIYVKDLIPSEIFLNNYYGGVETYKGYPCYSEKDKFKINLLMKLKEMR